jgi:hypothetical protein
MIGLRHRAAWGCLAILAAVAVLARIPQLASSNLLAEGDECTVGIMGLHVARFHDFPLFLYGQKYGLAIVEAPAAAVSFALFGAGPVTLKLAILTVWIAGAAFYFRAFARVLGTTRSFWITLLLVLMPAWAATSMKAWSGYVTAFAATGVAIDLMIGNVDRRLAPWFGAGVATAVIYFAQPLWLPGLLPIVLYHLVASRRLRCWIAYAGAALGPFAAMEAIKRYWLAGTPEVWFGPTAGNAHLLASVPAIVRQLYVSLTGSFYFSHAVAPGRLTAAMGGFWLTVLCLALVMQIYRVVTRRYLLWSHLLAASIGLTVFATWILLEERDARYVMAIDVPLVFLAGVELFDLADRFHVPLRRTVAAILIVAALQAGAMREFAGYSYMWWSNGPATPSETKTLHKLIGYMQSRGVTRAYAMNILLPWSITFYSNEGIIARSKGSRDRYPPYITAVDRALEAGRPVAIVGYVGYTYGLERLVPDPKAIVDIDGKYFVYIAPDRELLQRAGFQLVR